MKLRIFATIALATYIVWAAKFSPPCECAKPRPYGYIWNMKWDNLNQPPYEPGSK